jgi:hypothetical protein
MTNTYPAVGDRVVYEDTTLVHVVLHEETIGTHGRTTCLTWVCTGNCKRSGCAGSCKTVESQATCLVCISEVW